MSSIGGRPCWVRVCRVLAFLGLLRLSGVGDRVIREILGE
jgi:hypothetical protein